MGRGRHFGYGGKTNSVIVTSKVDAISESVGSTVQWSPLRLGAGGFVTGIDISPDGETIVVRTDTTGAYLLNQDTSEWISLIDDDRLPVTMRGPTWGEVGCYEIAVAPSNSSIIYMTYSDDEAIFDTKILKSTNRGASFTETGFTPTAGLKLNPNSTNFRYTGPKMAIDPNDPNVVYMGCETDGLWRTVNGGTSWSKISTSSVPAALSNPDGHGLSPIFVVISPVGTTSGAAIGAAGSVASTIYVHSYGNGVYKSTDGGATWALTSSGPTKLQHMRCGIDGVLYAITSFLVYVLAGGTSVLRYASNAWTDISPTGGSARTDWWTVATHPTDAGTIRLATSGGGFGHSTNANSGTPTYSVYMGLNTIGASDIPWIKDWMFTVVNGFNGYGFDVGDIFIDPVNTSKVWASCGVGVAYSTSVPPSTMNFTFLSKGIEQLVVHEVVCPASAPVVCLHDRGVMRVGNPDVIPSAYGIDNTFQKNLGLDWASSDPNTLFTFGWGYQNGVGRNAGKSTDGGATWTRCSGQITEANTGGYGFLGCLAASTPSNAIIAQYNNGDLWRTADGGANWSKISLTSVGIPAANGSVFTGWSFSPNFRRKSICADRVLANTFYAANHDENAIVTPRIIKSTDGGATWSIVYSGAVGPLMFWHSKIKAVPSNAGHVMFTNGRQYYQLGVTTGVPRDDFHLHISTDGCENWTTITNTAEVTDFGFGAAAPGNDYPTIFIAGWVDVASTWTYGVWRSTNSAAQWAAGSVTWTFLGDFPNQDMNTAVASLDGDKAVYGTVYCYTAAQGGAYAVLV